MAATLTITVQSQQVRQTLAQLAGLGRNPEALMAALGPRLVSNVRQRFRDGVDPHGARWDSYAPLNPLYAADKRGPSILIGAGGMASGLMRSITSRAEGNALIIGSALRYAGVHQFGAVIRPKAARALRFSMGGRTIVAKQVTIPARPYLGLSNDDREVIVGELEDFLARMLRR